MATKAKASVKASPTLPMENGVLRATNAEIMNTVRKYAPSDYQSRIPPVTQGSVREALKALNAYQPFWNVFFDVLLNRIGLTLVRQRSFTNPLSIARRVSLKYGETIQEMQVNLIRAKDYDKDAMNVFGIEGREPDIHQQFHTVNSRLKYNIAVPMQEVLSGAFTEENSLSALMNSSLATPYDSMENDEYLQQVELFKHYDEFEGFYNEQVDMFTYDTAHDTAEEAARKLAKAVRFYNKKFRFYSQDYSSEGRKRGLSTLATNTYLVIGAGQDAAISVDMLAYMFNEENGRLLADRIVVLPELPDPTAVAYLVEDDFLLTADKLGPLMLTAPMNTQNLSQVHTLHVWRALSYSLFANAVKFSTQPSTEVTRLDSTVTGVTVLDAESHDTSTVESWVDSNGYAHTPEIQLVATVQGTNGPSQAVAWSIEGYDGRGRAWGLPADCFVDSKGVFHAGHTPAGTTVIIKATSVQNPAFSAQYTAIIEGQTYATAIAASPASVNVAAGSSQTVSVTFTPETPTDDGFTAALVDGTHAAIQVDEAGHTVKVTGVSAGTDTLVLAATGAESGNAVTKTVAITVTE